MTVPKNKEEVTTMSKYIVFQVGCIECGVSSYPVKCCETVEEAISVANAHPSTWDTEGGEGYVTIIDVANCKEIEFEKAER